MRLIYMVTNAAWTFVLGDSIVGLDGWPRFFQSREAAAWAATERGLRVKRNGWVAAA